MSSRPRVALVAFAASPYRGSEEGVGWNRALEISKYCDVTVFCEELAYRADIERWMAENGRPSGMRFVFVAKTWAERQLEKAPRGIMLCHASWQRRIFRVIVESHRERAFDLGHQLTYGTYRESGSLWKLGIPVVWGPVGGTQNTPWRFLPALGLRDGLSEAGRGVLNRLTLAMSRRLRRAAGRAHAIFASNSTNVRDLQRGWKRPIRLLSDVGVRRVGPIRGPRELGPLRILWCGLLIPRKALPLLLRALAPITEYDWRLEVLGDGPRGDAWRRLAKRLGMEGRVTWRGSLPHAAAIDAMNRADVFVFSSLRDSTGTVMLEALAAGTPVICLDHQGARDFINDTCGLKIPVTTPRDTIEHLRDSLRRLAATPSLLDAMRLPARQRAAEFLWEQTTREIIAAYESALGRSLCDEHRTSVEPPNAEFAVGGP